MFWLTKMRELTNLRVRSAEIHRNFLLLIQAKISKMLLQSMITVVQKINFNVFQSSSKLFGSKLTLSPMVSWSYSQLKWPKHACQGGVSRTFRELSKISLRKYTMPEITFMVIISSWNFLHGFGYTYKISAWNSHNKYDYCNTRILWEYFRKLAKR